jgi:ATP-binding cassette subfamily B protein
LALLFKMVLQSGPGSAAWLLVITLLCAVSFLFQAFLVRLIATKASMPLAVMLVVTAAQMLLTETPAMALAQQMGRHLENRLRLRLFLKIPQITERYFGSRTASDMAGRAHSLFRLRDVPVFLQRMARTVAMLAMTTAALIGVMPGQALGVLLVASLALAVPWVLQFWLVEKDLKVREQLTGVERVHLEALLGTMPLRTHDAGDVFRWVYEGALSPWVAGSREFVRLSVVAEALVALVPMGVGWVLIRKILQEGMNGASALLATYWLLSLPGLGQELAFLFRRIPAQRNVALRALEPLNAPEESPGQARQDPGEATEGGVHLSMKDLTVVAGGHTLLSKVSVELPAGTSSGAGGTGRSSGADRRAADLAPGGP